MYERLTVHTPDNFGYAEYQLKRGIDDQDAIRRLAVYEDSGLSPEEVQKMARAKAEGRLAILPCKVGDTYSGICREMVPNKKGWKTKEWIETGIVVRFIVTAELTAEKVDYNHKRNIDEVGEVWFVGEGHREAAEKALEGSE